LILKCIIKYRTSFRGAIHQMIQTIVTIFQLPPALAIVTIFQLPPALAIVTIFQLTPALAGG